MGELADRLQDPDVLRLENLDTDLRPPHGALVRTKQAVDDDRANSYLPFFGLEVLRRAAADLLARQSGQKYDWQTECVITAGGLSGILNVLLATLEPGDEVLMTDPVYSGLLNRVRLAGGVPRLVPLIPSPLGWRLDVAALSAVDTGRVTAALLMSPSMPTGAVFTEEEWGALVSFCQRAGCWLINDAAMERILYDGRAVIHPASFPGMRDRVITVGAASKEYRMIGWRVGWVVGPAQIMRDVAREHHERRLPDWDRDGSGRDSHPRSCRWHPRLRRGMAAPARRRPRRPAWLLDRSAAWRVVAAARGAPTRIRWSGAGPAAPRNRKDRGHADGELGEPQGRKLRPLRVCERAGSAAPGDGSACEAGAEVTVP